MAYGDEVPANPKLQDGYFVEPTILPGVTNEMELARDEIFGPVFSVIPFRDEEEAIWQTNDTRYGLAAGVWTRDLQRAHRVAHALKVSTVWINSYRTSSFIMHFSVHTR